MSHPNAFNNSLITELGGAALIVTNLLLRPLTRPWYGRWGATPEELAISLPGDELVPEPQLTSTRAITIHATPKDIWPWIAQIGQGRGGLYSYEKLENLAGCQMQNAASILPECQDPQPGDLVRLGPPGYPALPIHTVVPDYYLLIFANGMQEARENPGSKAPPVDWCWLYYLRERSDGSTRLIIRTRMSFLPSFGMNLTWKGFLDPIHFSMERQTLLGIKKRVECH